MAGHLFRHSASTIGTTTLPNIYVWGKLQNNRYLLASRRCRCHSGYGPPFTDLDQTLPNFPFKHPLYHIWLHNSICKLFVDVLLNHHTTFLDKGKNKKIKKKHWPFRSNSTAFIIASCTVYARIRYEQTTAFELLK